MLLPSEPSQKRSDNNDACHPRSTARDGEVLASTASFSSRTALSSNSLAYRSSISWSEPWSTSPDSRRARRASPLEIDMLQQLFLRLGHTQTNVTGRRPLRFVGGSRKTSSALWCVHKPRPYKCSICGAEIPDLPMPVLKHQMSHVRRRPVARSVPEAANSEPEIDRHRPIQSDSLALLACDYLRATRAFDWTHRLPFHTLLWRRPNVRTALRPSSQGGESGRRRLHSPAASVSFLRKAKDKAANIDFDRAPTAPVRVRPVLTSRASASAIAALHPTA